MDMPLLITKLYVSFPPPRLVTSSYLIDQLCRVLARKRTVLSALAGLGRMVLLSVGYETSGSHVLTALRSPQSPPIKSALARLSNQLAALSDDIVLVMDDYYTLVWLFFCKHVKSPEQEGGGM